MPSQSRTISCMVVPPLYLGRDSDVRLAATGDARRVCDDRRTVGTAPRDRHPAAAGRPAAPVLARTVVLSALVRVPRDLGGAIESSPFWNPTTCYLVVSSLMSSKAAIAARSSVAEPAPSAS